MQGQLLRDFRAPSIPFELGVPMEHTRLRVVSDCSGTVELFGRSWLTDSHSPLVV